MGPPVSAGLAKTLPPATSVLVDKNGNFEALGFNALYIYGREVEQSSPTGKM